jgi:hypothetical protein
VQILGTLFSAELGYRVWLYLRGIMHVSLLQADNSENACGGVILEGYIASSEASLWDSLARC